MSLFRTFGVILFLNIIDYFFAPITMILVVKVLSVADYGLYSLAMTILGLVLSFCSLGLGQYNYRTIPGRPEDEQYRVLGKSLTIELIAALLGTAVAIIWMREDFLGYSIAAFFAIKAFLSILNNELLRFVGYQKKNILKSVIAFIDSRFWLLPLVVFFLAKSVSVRTIFLSQIIGSGITFAVFAVILKRGKLLQSFRLDGAFAREALHYSLPLVLVDLGMYLLEAGSRYILKAFTSYSDIGLFSFVYSWCAIIFKFGMLFLYILQPYFSECFHRYQTGVEGALDEYRGFLRVGFKFSFILLLATIICFSCNYLDIILLLAKAQYLETRTAMFLLSPFPIFMFLAYFYQIIMVLTGNTSRLPFYYLIMGGVSLVLNLALVPAFGYNGAALASTLSYAALSAILFWFSRGKFSRLGMTFQDAVRIALFAIVFLGINLLSPLLVEGFIPRMVIYAVAFTLALFGFGIFKQDELALVRKI